jgi:hypothetical protein
LCGGFRGRLRDYSPRRPHREAEVALRPQEKYNAEFAIADEVILSIFILVRSEQFRAVQSHLIHTNIPATWF